MAESLADRQTQSSRLRTKFKDRVPVIVNPATDRSTPPIDKNKYLVPSDLTFGEFMYVVRKRIKGGSLSANQALVGFARGVLPPTSKSMAELYSENAEEDGFLYVVYSLENTFGAFHRLQTAKP